MLEVKSGVSGVLIYYDLFIMSIFALEVPFCGNYYALINRARGPYEEIFVLTFKAYGPNAVRSMRLERQNKYFLVWTKISVNKSFIVYPYK